MSFLLLFSVPPLDEKREGRSKPSFADGCENKGIVSERMRRKEEKKGTGREEGIRHPKPGIPTHMAGLLKRDMGGGGGGL